MQCSVCPNSPGTAMLQLQLQREDHAVLLLAGLLTLLPGHALQVHTQALRQLEGWKRAGGEGKHSGPTHRGLLVEFV